MCIPFDLVMPPLGNGLTVMLAYFQNDVCVKEFTAVLFAMEKTGNKSNAPYWRSG